MLHLSCFLSWVVAKAGGSSPLTCFVHVNSFILVNLAEMCSQCFSPSGIHHASIVYRSELGGKNLKCLEIIRWLAFPWVPCHPEQAFWRAHYSLLPLVLIKENKNRSIIEYNVDFETRHCLKGECKETAIKYKHLSRHNGQCQLFCLKVQNL